MTIEGIKCRDCGYECEYAAILAEAGPGHACPICKDGVCPDCRPASGDPVPPLTVEAKPTRENDMPLAQLAHGMFTVWAKGLFTLQKFTCAACGARQTIVDPNVVYTSGVCEECGVCTNLQHRGGGYTIVGTNVPEQFREMAAEIAATPNHYEQREGRA